MVKHEYIVTCLSVAIGFAFVGLSRLLDPFWFSARITLLLAIICFVPAGLVLLAHVRQDWFGGLRWDKSNDVWTTRRSPKVERVEIVVMSLLWSLILIALVILVLSRS